MTRIVRKPLDESLVEFSKLFDKTKGANPELTLTQFCKTNRVPYQALRATRANMVRVHKSSIQYSRFHNRKAVHEKPEIDTPETLPRMGRTSKKKTVDVFDELEKAYATIGRLVMKGAKL